MHKKVHRKICRSTMVPSLSQPNHQIPINVIREKSQYRRMQKAWSEQNKWLVSFFDRSLLLSTSDTSLKAHQSPNWMAAICCLLGCRGNILQHSASLSSTSQDQAWGLSFREWEPGAGWSLETHRTVHKRARAAGIWLILELSLQSFLQILLLHPFGVMH